MISKKSCIQILLCLAIIVQFHTLVNAGCVCNEKGIDYCEGCNERRVVRPKTKNYGDSSNLKMPPIGDNCWCSKLLIEPAAQKPKPCYKHKKTKCGCSNRYSYEGRYSDNIDYSHLDYASTIESKKDKDDTQPADPVSVSLAVQAGKAIGVPEAKLAYGFVQKPVDGLKKVYFSTVPEENLFKLKSEVITLKKRTQNSIQKEEEDWAAMEEDEELDGNLDDSDDNGEQPQLTYKQLGYVAEEFKNPKFRRVSSTCKDDEYERSYGRKRVLGRVSVDCGFKPGRVSSYRKSSSSSSSSRSSSCCSY